MSEVTVQVKGRIAIVTINNPPVNAVNQVIREGLWDAKDKTDANHHVAGVLLICAGRSFVCGADIKEFGKPPVAPDLPALLLHIESASKPWVAAIHGYALGGGLELALACGYRVAMPTAKLGFPEVNLGLIPGAGGTVRAPRLISVRNAVSLITSGKPVSASKAKEFGLIDEIVEGDLQEDASEYLVNRLDQIKPEALILRKPIEALDDRDWEMLAQKIQAKARGNQTPIQAMQAVRDSTSLPAEEAMIAERAKFLQLSKSDQSQALRYMFFVERNVGKLPQLKNVQPRPLKAVTVIGGGLMGSGIATASLLAGLTVIMIEQNEDALSRGIETVKKNLANSLSRGLISESKHHAIIAQLSGSTDYTACTNSDMVIEAVFEDMDVKKEVFRKLDTVSRADAVLATNTSYLDVNEIASVVSDSSRVLGLHFFSPAHIMKLLEVVRPDKLADDALATGFSLAKKLNKIAVPSGVCDGFIGNRMMSSYRRECEYMIEDGALPQEVDAAMVQFGFPMGFFTMADMAGLDIGWAMRKRQAATRPASLRYVDIADKICEMGRFGRKTGSGWYDYSSDSKPGVDPIVEEIILSESARKNITRESIPTEKIIERILNAMQREGQLILDEGIAVSQEAIDATMVNGYGFPRWKGGPMFMAVR